MKIGDIEFKTTADEIEAISRDFDSRKGFLRDRPAIEALQMAVLEAFGGPIDNETHALMTGMLYGAEIYRRRLAEKATS